MSARNVEVEARSARDRLVRAITRPSGGPKVGAVILIMSAACAAYIQLFKAEADSSSWIVLTYMLVIAAGYGAFEVLKGAFRALDTGDTERARSDAGDRPSSAVRRFVGASSRDRFGRPWICLACACCLQVVFVVLGWTAYSTASGYIKRNWVKDGDVERAATQLAEFGTVLTVATGIAAAYVALFVFIRSKPRIACLVAGVLYLAEIVVRVAVEPSGLLHPIFLAIYGAIPVALVVGWRSAPRSGFTATRTGRLASSP